MSSKNHEALMKEQEVEEYLLNRTLITKIYEVVA